MIWQDPLKNELHLALMCQCSRCREILDMDPIEHLLDTGHIVEWVEQMANLAQTRDWGMRGDELLCSSCRMNRQTSARSR